MRNQNTKPKAKTTAPIKKVAVATTTEEQCLSSVIEEAAEEVSLLCAFQFLRERLRNLVAGDETHGRAFCLLAPPQQLKACEENAVPIAPEDTLYRVVSDVCNIACVIQDQHRDRMRDMHAVGIVLSPVTPVAKIGESCIGKELANSKNPDYICSVASDALQYLYTAHHHMTTLNRCFNEQFFGTYEEGKEDKVSTDDSSAPAILTLVSYAQLIAAMCTQLENEMKHRTKILERLVDA